MTRRGADQYQCSGDLSHEPGGDSRDGSAGPWHHQQEGRSSHQNKPQSELSRRGHVDLHQHRDEAAEARDEAAEARVEARCVTPPLAGPVQLNHAIRS